VGFVLYWADLPWIKGKGEVVLLWTEAVVFGLVFFVWAPIRRSKMIVLVSMYRADFKWKNITITVL
jgi:hypothetical protein